jgi:hypothetical protein
MEFESRLLVVSFLGLALASCDKKENPSDRGVAPPPIASSKPGACQSGGGTVSDKASAGFFARSAGDYCIDPNGETRAFGDNAPDNIDKVCTELFDGECEVYKGFGLKRVVTLRYVDGKGSPGAVNVYLSQFGNKEGAFAFFTKRVVADDDPLESAPAKLEAGGLAAMGTGNVNLWRGEYVAELSYTNEVESPEQLKETGKKVLPEIAKPLGDKLPGDKTLPASAQLLPAADQINLGISFSMADAIGVKGAGSGAVGYYKKGDKRWRVLAISRPDEDSAKDVMKTFKSIAGSRAVKGQTFDVLGFERRLDDSSPKIQWLVARSAGKVFGIGDEEHALDTQKPATEAAKVSLSEAEKLEQLKTLVGAPAAEPAK